MHFFKVSLKEELLCVRITITLRNVCVSDLEWGMLPEGAESMRLPSGGAIQRDGPTGLEFVQWSSTVTSGPSCG